MSTMFWIWMAAMVVFLILELLAPGLIFACFGVAAIAAAIYGQFNPGDYYWQIGIFVGVSIILLPSMRPFAKRITRESPTKSNVDRLIGRVALVTKPIDPDLGGQVIIDGETWRAAAQRPFAEKAKVVVKSIDGNKVVVEEADSGKE